MTVESLMNRFTQYVSWLYFDREWAGWELQTMAITALVLLLFILIHRRKAKAGRIVAKQIVERASTIGIKLDAGTGVHQGSEGDTNSRSSIVSISKNNGNQKRWKETTKKWKNYQKLIEQLQQETAKYKQAEECLEQQFVKLKAANEQLRQEITGSNQVIEETELSRTRTIGSFGKQQDRILNPSGVISEDS
jgi:peptidoglycan hydrolase CwlO-like protein